MTAAHERLGHRGGSRLKGLLEAGDPRGEVRMAWHAKETVRGVYRIADAGLADRYTRQLAADLQHESCPSEVNQLGRTIRRRRTPIVNRRSRPAHQRRHRSRQQPHQTNQRVAFGFRSFANYRIRALLYAGRPDWDLLPAHTPP